MAKELNLRGRKETILVNTLLQQESQVFEVVEFDLQHASSDGDKIKVQEGLVSKKFNIAERYLPKDIDRNLYPHFADLDIPDVSASELGGGAFEGQTHIFLGGGGAGQDRIFKKVLLFAHAVVTGLLPPPPSRFAPLSKGGDIPRNTAPGGRIS